MAYTCRDTPATVARIERDLHAVLEALKRADPALESVILTGGFSRGEGAMLDGRPQNDYDLVAVRGLGPTVTPYPALRSQLEQRLGIHVDVAPVPSWRLPWVARSIFWYETALCGRTLWGQPMLDRIPVRSPGHLDPAEGLRLLVNRAAGLLLATGSQDPNLHRIQACKALLASLDAHLFARGEFPATQGARWQRMTTLRAQGTAPADFLQRFTWHSWAYKFKVDPADALRPDPREAWRVAATSLLAAVPAALQRAGLASLDDYATRDGLVDQVVYCKRAVSTPGIRPFARHPTGRVRVGTLRLLEASLDGYVRPEAFKRCLGDVAKPAQQPLRALAALRGATLQ